MALRIKKDIDLKELEKFGLKPKYDEDTGEIIAYEERKNIFGSSSDKRLFFKRKKIAPLRFFKNTNNDFIFVENYFKGSEYIGGYNRYCDFDTLYDLIKADMVEKVEE